MAKLFKRTYYLLAVVILLIIVGGGLLGLLLIRQSPSSVSANQTTAKPKSNVTRAPLSAGGVVVPAAFVNRARSLGYYCPSWAAQPGVVASTICVPLDK